MNRPDAGDGGLPSIPGNVHALANECRRLRLLATDLSAVAQAVRGARIDRWHGVAHDRFTNVRHAVGQSYLAAADAVELAAAAVDRHQFTLAEAQPRARHAAEDAQGRGPEAEREARETIERLRGQVDEVAGEAAAAVVEATRLLDSVKRVLPVALPVVPPLVWRAPERRVVLPATGGPVAGSPVVAVPDANSDRAAYARGLQVLCNALLTAGVRTA